MIARGTLEVGPGPENAGVEFPALFPVFSPWASMVTATGSIEPASTHEGGEQTGQKESPVESRA